MSVKSFLPTAVKREHIKPITVIYGNDVPGIALRLKRFENILEENMERPTVFANTTAALPYMSCGDLFSDSICIVISDATDMILSSAQSKKLMQEFLSTASTYDDTSTIIIGIPAKTITSQIKILLNKLKEKKALIREVSVPSNTELAQWIIEYAKSNEQNLSYAAAEKIVKAGNNEPEQIKAVYASIGAEAEFMNMSEIQEWLDTDEEIQPYVLRRYIVNGDVYSIDNARAKFDYSAAGYRTFMLKMRLACTDLVIASLSNGNANSLSSYKSNMYGKFQDVSSIMKDANCGTSRHFVEIYQAIQDELSFISGGSKYSAKEKIKTLIALTPMRAASTKRDRIIDIFNNLEADFSAEQLV